MDWQLWECSQLSEVFPCKALAMESRVGHSPVAAQAVGISERVSGRRASTWHTPKYNGETPGNYKITMCVGASL